MNPLESRINDAVKMQPRPLPSLAAFALLLAGFWMQLKALPLADSLGRSQVFAFVGFALLLAPLWFFAFGAGVSLRVLLQKPGLVGCRLTRIATPALLVVPYLLYALPLREFQWRFALSLALMPILLSGLLELAPKGQRLLWQDAVVLFALALILELRLLSGAWPHPGLGSLPKLYLCDVALYLYLVVRELDGAGYCFTPNVTAYALALREWLYFIPFAFGLGFGLHFITFYPRAHSLANIAAIVLVTFFLTSVPEELFYRGLLQNLLEPHLGRLRALLVASLFFGLSHFHKGAAFNWRYVLMAAVAGIFYGRAWRARRQLLASSLTHTMVDVVWSLWFR